MDDAWAERIWKELHRIANALETMTEPSLPEPETPTCSHPLECRIDLGVTNGQPEWVCSICKFHQMPPLRSDPATTTRDHL